MTEFCYNNITHTMTSVSLFYVMYRFNSEIFPDAEGSDSRKKALITKKRVLKIQSERKLLET